MEAYLLLASVLSKRTQNWERTGQMTDTSEASKMYEIATMVKRKSKYINVYFPGSNKRFLSSIIMNVKTTKNSSKIFSLVTLNCTGTGRKLSFNNAC